MSSDPVSSPPTSPSREAVLQRYDILDTRPEDRFDRIAELAARAFDVPTGLVTFIDDEREWMKARRAFDAEELPLDESFGARAVAAGQPVVVEDALEDPRFAQNPAVTDRPGIRFYAGTPLRVTGDVCIGTVAVMDTAPHAPSPAALQQLRSLAALVSDLLEERRRPTEEEKLIDALLSSSSANAVVLGKNGTILQTNQNWETFAQKNDLNDLSAVGKGVNYLDALDSPPDAPEKFTTERARNGLERVLRGDQETFDLVYPCHGPEEQRWFEMRVRRLDHPRARAIVSHWNVTDRRWKRHQRRVLETAVEHAQESIMITEGGTPDDTDPPITYVNPAFTAMTGYESAEILGTPPSILQGPDTEAWVLREMQQCLKRGDPFEGEAINYRKDGTPFINHWSIAPVRDKDGTLTHWVSLQRDVTEERHMEKRLLQAQERERQRIAEEMHHEMGGLLTSLQMAVTNAHRQTEDSSCCPRALEPIKSIADELSDIVRTLTERLHSRIIEDYGLSDALSRMTTDFRERHGLSVEVYNEIPDEKRFSSLVEKISYRGIYEALKNIVEHARTDDAQLLLNVETKTLRIHVVDEGAGFEPSQELGKDKYGLVAIKKRIDRMNGRFEIHSSPDEGTRVSMTLPLSIGPAH